MFINKLENEKYDVVIIGSGPAGISTALELAKRTSSKIIIVESGDFDINPEIQKLSEVDSIGDLPSGYFSAHSQRIFGGTSNIWSGACAILEERSFLNGDWPINYDDLLVYYKEAATILDLSEQSYEIPYQKIGINNELIYKPFYLSAPTRFGGKYRNFLEENQQIDVLLNRSCIEIIHNKSVDYMVLQESGNPHAEKQKLYAKNYVVACGGIGNPRLLQLSNIGINSPVGNFFMGHPHIGSSGEIEIDIQLLNEITAYTKGINVIHAFQLDNQFCKNNNLLNFSVGFLYDIVDKRTLYGKSTKVNVSNTLVRSEMFSLFKNQITLDDIVDSQGQRKTQIDFSFSYEQLAQQSWEAFAEALLRSGIGRASTLRENFSIGDGGGHFIGTTRMGTSEEESVVDANCKIHGLDNLYVAGSSVFSASGAANPTFTIVALAIRLAQHISLKL